MTHSFPGSDGRENAKRPLAGGRFWYGKLAIDLSMAGPKN
jgi:hypothetical protein